MINSRQDSVDLPSRIDGDDQPLPPGVTVRVVGAAANGGNRNARRRGRRIVRSS